MKSMKMKEEDKVEPAGQPMDKESYPMGLQVHLTEKELDKLGMKDLPEPGTKMTMQAKVHVNGAMMHDGPDGKHKSLHLQITHMAIGGEKEGHEETDGETKGKKLYGEKEK